MSPKRIVKPKKASALRRPKRVARRVPAVKTETDAAAKEPVKYDVNENATDFFTKSAPMDSHYEACEKNRLRYLATLLACEYFQIEIIPNARAHSLATAFARHDSELIKFLMQTQKQYKFVDVLKALSLLDSKREKMALEKKLARIEKAPGTLRAKRAGEFKRDLDNLTKKIPLHGSCSGAVARAIRRWVKTFSAKQLEFFAIQLPTEPWKKMADLVHFNPEKDFPQAPWFLRFCFGGEAPKDSMLECCRQMTKENVNELLPKFDSIPFSFLKKFNGHLSDESKERIAKSRRDLDTLLWNYEDISCQQVDLIILERLNANVEIKLSYGKLMERLLMFKDKAAKVGNEKNETLNKIVSMATPIAGAQLATFKSTLAAPVVVIGDASGSMSVAIRTATIISSLLTAICSAKLTFFNTADFKSAIEPKTIDQVLEVAYSTNADGGTAPAASLVPFFDAKEVVKTFIIVTDEEENDQGKTADKRRWNFFDLFMEYRREVYPASLIFISFLRGQHARGQMYSKFQDAGVTDVQQFKFDNSRPDLAKLDSILGILCSKSSNNFAAQVEHIESLLKTRSLEETHKLVMSNSTPNDQTTSTATTTAASSAVAIALDQEPEVKLDVVEEIKFIKCAIFGPGVDNTENTEPEQKFS